MRPRHQTLAILYIVALLTISTAPKQLQAQANSGGEQSTTVPQRSSAPTIRVYTRETLVDVTVTDKDGKPVHGLTRSDFSVTEDDKPQSIRSFKEFDNTTPAAAPTPRKLPPNTYTNVETATGPLNVLLLDYINGNSITEARATKFIDKLPPGTRGAVLGLGMRLTVVQGPTSDRGLLLKAVTRYVEPFASEDSSQASANWATIDQMDEVATYLAGIAGRKNLIWLGTGIPSIVLPPEIAKKGNVPDVSPALRKTYAMLADAEVTIYPVDPSGVGKLGPRHLAMEAVAESTGGIAFYETNDVGNAVVRAIEAGASYYTLSYAPPSLAYDSKYHTISIKVVRPDLHLVYRKGYNAEDPVLMAHTTASWHPLKTPESHADALVAALSPIMPPATQLLFDVRVEPSTDPENPFDPPVFGVLDPKFNRAPLTRYGFLFTLPKSQIAFADTGGGTYSGSLKFDLAAFDNEDKMVTSGSQTMKLPLTNEEYQQFIATPFQLYLQLDLPPGLFMLRVGVLDGVSSKIGTIGIPLTVGNRRLLPKPGASSAAPKAKH